VEKGKKQRLDNLFIPPVDFIYSTYSFKVRRHLRILGDLSFDFGLGSFSWNTEELNGKGLMSLNLSTVDRLSIV